MARRMIARFVTETTRIYRLECRFFPHLTGSVHLLLGEGFPPILIDAGSGEGDSSSEILAALEQIGPEFGERFVPSDLAAILLTHAHIDHFGGAGELAKTCRAEVWSHPFEASIVSSFDERSQVACSLYRHFLDHAGAPAEEIGAILDGFGFLPGRVPSTPVARRLNDGDQIGPIRVHHLPGHAPGHLALEVGPFFLSGDIVLSQTLTQIWPERLHPQTGLIRYLESLAKLRRLVESSAHREPPVTLLPGHEEKIEHVAQRLDLVEKSMERRTRRVIEILRASDEPMTLWQIARRMYLAPHINRTFFALCDTAARLEYLQLFGHIQTANSEALYHETTRLTVPHYFQRKCF